MKKPPTFQAAGREVRNNERLWRAGDNILCIARLTAKSGPGSHLLPGPRGCKADIPALALASICAEFVAAVFASLRLLCLNIAEFYQNLRNRDIYFHL